MPLFLYCLEQTTIAEEHVSVGDLILFMRKIIDRLQLATECIVISLIYLEKMMLIGGIEIRRGNWKAIFFTAILLASKFWEDINFWNVDYSEAFNYYSLKAINRMESEFLSLCGYNLFVSAELYSKYYVAIKELNEAKQTHVRR